MAHANDHETRPSRIPWPPFVYLAAIAVSILASVAYPLPWFGAPLADILFAIGGLLVAGFAFLDIQAFLTLRKAGTSIRASSGAEVLVTHGPFAISRNPIYLASTMVMIGVGFITGMPWFLIFAVIASVITQKLAIEPEEKHLFLRFGKKYRDYQKKVRRWI